MKEDITHLYIIGNGFDLHHKIPSSFLDFYSWLEHHDIYAFNRICEFFEGLAFREEWRYFEQNLGEKDIREYAEYIARKNYPDFASDEFRDRDYHASEYAADEESMNGCTRVIDSFTDWINSLQCADPKYKIKICTCDSFFITFNYTTTLEDLYHVAKENILYIHGRCGDETYILGHGKSAADLHNEVDLSYPDPPAELDIESYEEWYRSQSDMFIDQAIDATIYRLAQMQKNVQKIISDNSDVFESLQSVKFIHIYGLSFSPIDMPYLLYIMRNVNINFVQWEVSYFSPEDELNIKNFIAKHNINNVKLIKLESITYRELLQKRFEFEE